MDDIIYAVILAGGRSTRTHPLTLTKPKPLLKVREKTILEHNLDQLIGIASEIIIIVGHNGDAIKAFLKDSYNGLKISYVNQREQLGTGHALLQVRDRIKGRFIVLNGDDLYSADDLKECVKHNYCILAKKVSSPEKFGVLTLDYNSCLKDIVEKPKVFISNIANTGLYILDDKIFSQLESVTKSERGEIELTDAVKLLASNEEIYCHISESYWIPIGFPVDLIKANQLLLKKLAKSIKGVLEDSAYTEGNILLKEGSLVEKTAKIIGPVCIGKNTVIKGAISNSSVGDNCSVAEGSEILDSLIMDNVIIEKGVKIQNAIISDKCRIKADSRLISDNDPIVLGENVIIEEHNSINLGIIIWPNINTKKSQEIIKDVK